MSIDTGAQSNNISKYENLNSTQQLLPDSGLSEAGVRTEAGVDRNLINWYANKALAHGMRQSVHANAVAY